MQKFKALKENEIDKVKDILDDTSIYLNENLGTPEAKNKDNENLSEIKDDKEESINSQI